MKKPAAGAAGSMFYEKSINGRCSIEILDCAICVAFAHFIGGLTDVKVDLRSETAIDPNFCQGSILNYVK